MKNGKGSKEIKKIAIMGGTFDPIHYGHMAAAEAVRCGFGIDKVLFIPSGRPPHKEADRVSDNEHRYLMTALATATNPYFEVSRMELDREGYTYTIDTIKGLRETFGENTKIYFITGADNIHQILTWKDAVELLGLCTFIAVNRPGYKNDELFSQMCSLRDKYNGTFHFLEIPLLDISSTEIRFRVRYGQPIKYLLPDTVADYIEKQGLYLKKDKVITNEVIKHEVKTALSEKRYLHTLGVIEESLKLCEIYNADSDKAYLAALLHDMAKELSNGQMKKFCKEYSIKIDSVMEKHMDLAHGFIAAEIASKELRITDDEILDAIRYHTTGRAGMCLLEKIIYIADFIEPNRPYFDGLYEVRALAYTDLDKAVICALEATIGFNTAKKRNVHPLSIEALQFEKEILNNDK